MDTVPLDWAELYRLQNSGKSAASMDLIYDSVCSFDRHPDFAGINALLEAVELDRLTTSNALAFLTASYASSPNLPYYRTLLGNVRTWFLTTKGYDEERTQSLLQGLDRVPEGRLIFAPITPPEDQ